MAAAASLPAEMCGHRMLVDGGASNGHGGWPGTTALASERVAALLIICSFLPVFLSAQAGDEHALPLADVLEGLGEVAMENEMWSDAIKELEQSLELKRRVVGPHDRQIAHLHYQIATAAVARLEKARHDAAQPRPLVAAPGEEERPSQEECEQTMSTCRKQASNMT